MNIKNFNTFISEGLNIKEPVNVQDMMSNKTNVTMDNLPTGIGLPNLPQKGDLELGKNTGDKVIIITDNYELPAIYQGRETAHLEESSPMDEAYILIPGYIPKALELKEVMIITLPIDYIIGEKCTIKAYTSGGEMVARFNVKINAILPDNNDKPIIEKHIGRFSDFLFESDYLLEKF